MLSWDQSYACLSPRDRGPARTHAQRAGSGDEKEATDWWGERVTATALSAYWLTESIVLAWRTRPLKPSLSDPSHALTRAPHKK